MNVTRLRIRVARTFYAAWRRRPFRPSPLAERLREALDMHELGVAIYRERMRREHPGASAGEVEALIRDWIRAPSPGYHWPALQEGCDRDARP